MLLSMGWSGETPLRVYGLSEIIGADLKDIAVVLRSSIILYFSV